ncbi:Nephrocystin-3 [Trichoplax sp. H2]|nr:Nephrocystin-3 [Trichoplax sp. H2]|eukprot:RDD40856.1 Nephrocystin-3 [Trichoplax sp. H2]
MATEQPTESTVPQNIQSLFEMAKESKTKFDFKNALPSYMESLHKIEIIPNSSADVERLKCNIYIDISDIYRRERIWTKAYEFCNLAQQVANELQDQVCIANCWDRQGSIKRLQGDLNGALHDFHKALEIKLTSLGEKNLNVSDSYNNIGLVKWKQGENYEALAMYDKSLEIKLSILDDNHPDISRVYHNKGLIYEQQGKYNDALSMYQKSFEIESHHLGDNHAIVDESYNNIGNIYLRQGKYDKALAIFKKCLEARLLVFGENHSSVAASYLSMGVAYKKKGRLNDCLSQYLKSLKIYLSILANDHPDLSPIYHDIGNVYDSLGKYDDALTMHNKSLKIQLSVYRENHQYVANNYEDLGVVYEHQGQYDKSLSMHEKSLKIRLAQLDENHPSIAASYKNIANIYDHQNRCDEALSMYQKSLKILLLVLGDTHPDISQLYQDMGNSYYKQLKYNQALTKYNEALNILHKTFGENHSSIADIYEKLAGCNNHLHHFDDAIAMQQKSETIRNCLPQEMNISESLTNQSGKIQEEVNKKKSRGQDHHKPQFLNNQSQLRSSDSKNHSYEQDWANNRVTDIQEKRYFRGYIKALDRGSCFNNLVRAMFTGPRNVGKSSIMRAFTRQVLKPNQPPTEIVHQSETVIEIAYNLQNLQLDDLRQIWRVNINSIMQTFNHDSTTQVSAGSVYRQTIADTGSIDFTYETDKQDPIASKDLETMNSKSSMQQLRDVFQYYFSLPPMKKNYLDYDSQYAKIWDFGGHEIYHITHRLFMSENSIYILVFNIALDIYDKVRTRDGQLLNTTYLHAMQEWLTSIIGSHRDGGEITANIDNDNVKYSLPIVILVASHGDLILKEEERIRRFNQFEREIRSHMPIYKNNIYSSGIVFNCNAEDNSLPTTINRTYCSFRLHHIIKKFAQSLPFMKSSIPIRWIIMATILRVASFSHDNPSTSSKINQIRTDSISNIMTIQEVINLAQKYCLYENEEELIDMLTYLHDLGEIIFCKKAGYGGIVVTNVDWLLKIFRSLIQCHECPSGSSSIISEYEKASQTGRLSRSYIDYVLQKLDEDAKKNILKLMETYDIVCQIKNDNDEDESKYFAPYLLRSDVDPFNLTGYLLSDWFYIGYENKDIPYISDGIYYCLLSACMKEWNNTKVELYHHCAKYYLANDGHYVIVKKEGSYIGLQYCYQKVRESEIEDKIMDKVFNSLHSKRLHAIIRAKLVSIIEERMPKFKNKNCQFYVQCSYCNKLTSVKCKINVQIQNWIQCQNCHNYFESNSISDWIPYDKKLWKDRWYGKLRMSDTQTSNNNNEISRPQLCHALNYYNEDFIRIIPTDEILLKLKAKHILSEREVTDIRRLPHEEQKADRLFNILQNRADGNDFLEFCDVLNNNTIQRVQKLGRQLEVKARNFTNDS